MIFIVGLILLVAYRAWARERSTSIRRRFSGDQVTFSTAVFKCGCQLHSDGSVTSCAGHENQDHITGEVVSGTFSMNCGCVLSVGGSSKVCTSHRALEEASK